MKTMKKLFCLAMTIILALALAAPAFAVQEGTLPGGAITINNAAKDETYKLYQILYLESYNAEAGTYAYKANSEWADWLATQTNFVKIENGYVSWVDNADAAVFAKAALQHADEAAIQPVATVTAENNVVNFSDLMLGYYLIDTTLGSLCSLDTTNSTVEIYEKNSIPSVTKQVWEDNGESYKNEATIDVTDIVKYQLTVDTGSNDRGDGTGVDSDYVITDVLPAGIKYNEGSVAVSDATGAWALTDDYTVEYVDQTLTIKLLSTGKLAQMGESAKITITYNANVTGGVQIGHTVGNVNSVTLKYHEQESKASATVYTYSIGGKDEGSPIKKVDGTEGPNKNQPLAGVKFILQNDTTKQYATFADDGKLTGWVADKSQATKLVTDADGAIYAYGLDADTYILTETDTLPGYNLLADTITADIAEDGVVLYDYTNDSDDVPANSITIENKSGTELPSTGGMGTTIFYTLGGVLVVGAAVLLVTKKRMSNAQ